MTYFKDVYQRFLANPRTAPLAADMSLIYVTSTTRIDQPDAVVHYLSRQSSEVKKKSEQIINAIEGSDSLCLDIETTLEFIEGGGAYLPSLDDNFLADRVVTIPTLHIVHYNAENQIQQVRIYWDQGALLKEVEVIGARGRSWPIRDAKEQTRLIKAAATSRSAPPPLAAPAGAGDQHPRPSSPGKRHIKDPYAADSLFDLLAPGKEDADAGRGAEAPRPTSPGKRHTKDPYAADSLTALLSPSKEATESVHRAEPARPASPSKRHTRDPYAAESLADLLSPSKEPAAEPVRPYAPSSAKPPPRDYSELFVNEGDEDAPPSPSRSQKAGAPKAGAGRAHPIRVYGDEDTAQEEIPKEEQVAYKTDPRKFSHFEIGGGDNAEREPKEEHKRGKSRHLSQWDFGDFTTPQKPTRAPPREEVPHLGWNEDEGETAEPAPAKPRVHQPRRDAEVHFDMTEENEDGPGRTISSYQNRGQRLYENRLFDDQGEAVPSEREKPEQLSVVGDSVHRRKDFAAHWEMTDDSPPPAENEKQEPLSVAANNVNRKKDFDPHWEMRDDSPAPTKSDVENAKPVPSDRAKAVKMMESSWDTFDDPGPSPQTTKSKTRTMSRNHRQNQPSWTFGDEDL